MTQSTGSSRLDRVLANLGYGSRTEIQRHVKNGLVTLDDIQLTDPSAHISRKDMPNLRFDGERLDPLSPITVMLHKCEGYICTSDKNEGKTVYDLLPERFSRRKTSLSIAGRLDKDASGLVILSDDGDLVHHLTSPKAVPHIPKHYKVRLADSLKGDEVQILARGDLMLRGEHTPLRPVEMEVIDHRTCRVVLTEGRYHQVKRMFAALGNKVTELHRYRIGKLDLKDLEEGQWRILNAQELALLEDVS